tara:strand:- start:66 stop:404 length:339 start_codon:yes stop_codon:yes gene_type:complete
MIWPPVKAWTSLTYINDQKHFVAINYGGELIDRWIILMSVLDSKVVVKVPWSELNDPSNWKSGWDENKDSKSYKLENNKNEINNTKSNHPSIDSGLTIPITKNVIRPWFYNG